MGSRGPNISEPRQPYLISKSASPTIAEASFSFLALEHSFFQWPKALHQAHWFGCNGAQGLHWDRLNNCPVPGADEVFWWARDRLSQTSSLHCKSRLFSFVPSGSLAERSLCLIPMSPSPSCQYSPGEAGIAWAVQLELDPGSIG